MISEEDFQVAAETADPELAFVRLETRFREKLLANLEGSQSSGASDAYIVEYMNHTIAAAQFFKLDGFDFWSVPDHNTRDIWDNRLTLSPIDRDGMMAR